MPSDPPDKTAASPSEDKTAVFGDFQVRGENNRILGRPRLASGNVLRIEGRDNRIEIGDGSTIQNLTVMIRGDGNRIVIGPCVRLMGRITMNGSAGLVDIGENTTIERASFVASEGSRIVVGRHCMFSYDVELRATDAHSILDLETGRRINRPSPIEIADHVWIGAHVRIGKGSKVPADCVVGQCALVTKAFNEPNCVIGGVPARILRRGVTWDRRLVDSLDDLPRPGGGRTDAASAA